MLDVINYYERLVVDQLWQLKQDSQETLSQTFLEDVACLALNSLPSCYVRYMVDKSAHLTELDHETMQGETRKAIEQAMVQVRLRSHENRGD